ncbi:MAG TPA: hypothetical protein V6D17_11660, partial [Candidatus Obscuribacterales bacterium]
MANRRTVWLSMATAVLLSQTASYGALALNDESASISTLLKGLNTQDWQRRNEVEQILNKRKGEAAEALVNALDSGDPVVQENAADILDRMSGNWDFIISDRGLATILGI